MPNKLTVEELDTILVDINEEVFMLLESFGEKVAESIIKNLKETLDHDNIIDFIYSPEIRFIVESLSSQNSRLWVCINQHIREKYDQELEG